MNRSLRVCGTAVVLMVASAVTLTYRAADEYPDCTTRSLLHRGESAVSGRQELTNMEVRKLAVAIECYGVAHEKYPGPTPGLVEITWLRDTCPESERFPRVDVWGSPFQYWSDGYHYAIVSFSSDGEPDHDYDGVLSTSWEEAKQVICGGRTRDTAVDIVFVDGNHCQWYEEGGD